MLANFSKLKGSFTIAFAIGVLVSGCADDGFLTLEEIPVIEDINSPMAAIDVTGSQPESALAHRVQAEGQARKWDPDAILVEVTCLAFRATKAQAMALIWCYVYVDGAQKNWLGVYVGDTGIRYVGRGKRLSENVLTGITEWMHDTDDAHMQLADLGEGETERALWVKKRFVGREGVLKYRPQGFEANSGAEVKLSPEARRSAFLMAGLAEGAKIMLANKLVDVSGENLGQFYQSATVTSDDNGNLAAEADYTNNDIELESGPSGIIMCVLDDARLSKVFYPIDASGTIWGRLSVDF